jgi:hypothetical protein
MSEVSEAVRNSNVVRRRIARATASDEQKAAWRAADAARKRAIRQKQKEQTDLTKQTRPTAKSIRTKALSSDESRANESAKRKMRRWASRGITSEADIIAYKSMRHALSVARRSQRVRNQVPALQSNELRAKKAQQSRERFARASEARKAQLRLIDKEKKRRSRQMRRTAKQQWLMAMQQFDLLQPVH